MSQPASMYNAPMKEKGWTSSCFDGISIKQTYTNPITKRVILFSEQMGGPYDNLLSCQSGVSNIDNTCVCNGSANSTPFLANQQNILGRLFVPEQPHMMPVPTNAVRCLIAERSPIHLAQPYEPFLGSCEN
jgi:hypothetical protein